IAPGYSKPVVHVLDASRAVGVVGNLINPALKAGFVQSLVVEYEKVRAQHGQQQAKPLLPFDEARRRQTHIEWKATDIETPAFTGVRLLSSDAGSGKATRILLSDLVPFIDWSPFFHTWEMRGRYPAILDNPEAKKLFQDARMLLDEIVQNNLLTASGAYGFFPANSVGEDVELYTDDTRSRILTTFHFLRQQMSKPADQHNHSLADFVAPKGSPSAPLKDYIGAFAVSAGFGVEELCSRFEKDHDDYNSIMTKALADRLAEAFAEYLHKRAREEWGYGKQEKLSHEELIREKYRGIRPAAGYPACPDHTEKRILWDLLGVEKNTGIRLTETCAMWPGASVSGLYFAHPDAKYFGVGKIGRDQVEDYHRRKGMDVETVERWLGPYLNYEP
ncbi:MAG: vitamin B12 dependent-methionine synthase activation domain-containing protein, partial [Limisphaerales bacterium]